MLQRRVYRSRRPLKVDSPLPRLEVAPRAEAMTNKRRKRAPGSCESCRPNDRLRASKRRAERIMHFGRLIGHSTTIICWFRPPPSEISTKKYHWLARFPVKRVRTTQAKGHDFNSLFANKSFWTPTLSTAHPPIPAPSPPARTADPAYHPGPTARYARSPSR